MLSPAHLTKLFEGLHEVLDFSSLEEVSLEANPATFDARKATLFRSLGVTRVSLGIQSFAPHVLHTLGREHSPEHAIESIQLLRNAAMPSINIDLMFSIPGQSFEDWCHTLTTALAQRPDHLSAYNLTYEEDTAFFESLKRGEMQQDEDRDSTFFYEADRLLIQAGFEHYETSNYSKPGHHSRHNMGYWDGNPYLGLGPSAVSTLHALRSANIADTAAYVSRMATVGNATQMTESLDHEAFRIERIALGLRTTKGISLDLLDPAGKAQADAFVAEDLAVIREGRFTLRGVGRALVDAVAAELI